MSVGVVTKLEHFDN